MRKFKALLMLVIIICGFAGLVAILGAEDISTAPEIGQEAEMEVSDGVQDNTIEPPEYDPYAIRDQADVNAVKEEIAYSWDNPSSGENLEEYPIVTDNMGSENWNLGSRAHSNTSTLITLQDFTDKAKYMDEVIISGMLYEDNNSDGQHNAGDTAIPRAQMHGLWDDGTSFRQYFTYYTQEDEDEGEGEAGKWEFNFTVTEPSLGPKELEVLYYGEWTQNGSWFYEVNDTDYTGADMDLDGEIDTWGLKAKSKLLDQDYLKDDDEDTKVDEEFFDFVATPSISHPWPSETYDAGGPADSDADGDYDEDVSAFIARFPTSKMFMISLWHDASMTAHLSQPSVVAGESFTIAGQVRDASVPSNEIGKKTLQIRFNGQLVGQTLAVEGYKVGEDPFSEYSFTYTVPKNIPAGTHEVVVRMEPAFNVSNNNYYEPVNITKYIKVLRPTEIIFDELDEDAWVYHTKQVFVNGSIVDKYFYRNYGIKEGIRLNVGSENFAKKYQFYLHWTKGSTYIKKGPFSVNNTNASFSIPLVVPGDQELGSVNVTMELKCANTYYLPSVNYTEYVTRATTSLDLWLDQNNNGRKNEPDTYITRVEYIDENGNKHYWNTAHIKGQLIDNELSTEKHPKGVAGQEVMVWWGYGESWQKQYTATTDGEGKFIVDVEIEYGHVLGPVTVAALFSKSPYSCYYDPSNYFDADGDPFSVVSMTHLTIGTTQFVKGEDVVVTGQLRDDRDIGMLNRTISIYWMSEKEKNDFERDRNKLGEPIGTVATGREGLFRFTEWEVPKEQPVGPVYIVAAFDGSAKWPNGATGTKYSPTDAYSNSMSKVVHSDVSAHTIIELDDSNSVKMTRSQKYSVKGRIWEAFKGEIRRNPVRNVPIEAYLIDSKNQEFFLGREYSFNEDPSTDGSFQITSTVPREAEIGYAQVRLQFNGTDYYLKCQNITNVEVWTDCEIRPLELPPMNNEGKIEIYFHKVSLSKPLRFHFKVLESDALENDVAVEYGTVWMNITAVDIVRQNNTKGVTNEHGRYIFNFTKPFRDTKYGKLFLTGENQEIVINITYEGGQFRNPAVRTYSAVLMPPEPPEPENPVKQLLPYLIFTLILIILVAIASFFFTRWYQRRARLRGMKRIIRRAADQLVAGNEYTAVIFKSYQKLGAHLRKYGYLRRDSETFREFEEAVRAALPIDRISMNEFLKLLEEARYSHHKIGEIQRNEAIKNLRNIEGSLERIILDETAAMKAMVVLEEADYSDTEIILVDGPRKAK
jgi:hypothetical protein